MEPTTYPAAYPTANDGVPIIFMLLIGAVALVIALGLSAILCYFIGEHYKAIPAEHRAMEPGKVWLLMIPFFSLYWVFPVFLGLSDSYKAALAARGRTDLGDCSRQVALFYCICVAASVVPCLNYLTAPAALVLLIIYLVRAADYKKLVVAA